MNLSRRRTLRLGALSLSGAAILASTGSRTALAASVSSPESVNIETDGDALSSLRISESDLDLSLEWKGIEDTSRPIEFDIGVRHNGGTTHWLAGDTPWAIAIKREVGDDAVDASGNAQWSSKPEFPLELVGSDSPFDSSTFTVDESPHDLEFALEFHHPDAGAETVETSLSLEVVSAVPDDGVARWTFNDADTSESTALDAWGNYDVTMANVTTGVTGANQTYETGEAYEFDGQNSGISTGYDFGGGQEISIGGWYYLEDLDPTTTGNSNYAAFVSWGGGTDNYNHLNWTGDRWHFGLEEGTHRSVSGDGSETAAQQWVHVMGTYDGSTLKLYVNGIEKGSATGPSSVPSHGDWYIGREDPGMGGDPWRFNGRIDDPRIYKRGLTATGVSNLYESGRISG